jgi:hypothetical protein
MNAAVWICAVLSTVTLFASERMNVSVCVPGNLRKSAVMRAQTETEVLFRFMDIEIVWSKCGSGPASVEAARQHWFTVRVRGDYAVAAPGTASLDILGRAFVSSDRPGNLADVYFRTIESLANREHIQTGVVMGCVMAHELGHLLLGPGHVHDGIMRSAWNHNDMQAIRVRCLRFDNAENDRIRRELLDAPSGR